MTDEPRVICWYRGRLEDVHDGRGYFTMQVHGDPKEIEGHRPMAMFEAEGIAVGDIFDCLAWEMPDGTIEFKFSRGEPFPLSEERKAAIEELRKHYVATGLIGENDDGS